MITLHESDITTFPMDNGIGVLRDVIRAYAEEELNGLFEFYMEYDSEGFLVDEIKEERIIKAKAQDKLGYQLFRIYSITKNHENDNLIVRAQHITYDLADNFVEKLEANNLTKKQVMELIGSSTVLPHPFNVTSSNTTTRSSTKLYRTNPLQMIGGMEGSVLQIWGGQIERDNFNLILHDRRGSDDGVKVTYEKNITGLEATFDISNLVTRIFPFVFIEGSDNEPDRLITVNGKYIDSPHINDYEKIYIKPIDYSNDERIDIQDKTDAQIRQQLEQVASRYFEETGNDKIKVDMEVQFEHLWETEEYKHLAVLELVGMGDTVTIEHSRLKVNATAIVNYIRYDCIAEKNEEVRLGSVKARLTDNVNKVVDVAEKAERAEQTANQAIRAANGKNTIYYGPDEPSSGIEGDLWFRVVDGEYTRTYRHDGIQWQLVLSVDVRDAMDEAQQAKDDAQQAVERANQATQQATNAINQAQTAFDEAQQALGVANNALDVADDALNTASNATSIADSAFNKAQESFNKAQEALDGLVPIVEFVGEAENEFATIKGDIQGLQTTVSGKVDESVYTTFVQQTNQALATKITMQDAEGVFVKETTFTATIDGLQTRVSDNEGNISNLTQIAQGLQTQVSDIEGNVSTLQQTAQGLQSSVTNLQYELDNLEIGGRNLIASSDITTNGGIIDKSRYATEGIIIFTANAKYDGMRISAKKLKPNSKYIFSYKYRKISGTLESFGGHTDYTWSNNVVYVDGQKSDHSYSSISSVFVADDTNIHTVEVHVITPDEVVETDYIYIQPNRGRETEVTVEIIDWQLVRGDFVPDWTPAPEDVDHQFSVITQTIDNITTRIGDAEGNISVLQQTSSSLAARLTDAEGNITTLTATVNGLQTTVSNVQGDVSSVTQLANALQTRMTNAEGDISTLTQTAQGLQSSVTNLQYELDNLEIGGRNYVIGNPEHNSVGSGYSKYFSVSKDLVNDFNTSEKKSFTMSCDIEINNATPHPSLPGILRIGFEISLYDTEGTRHIFYCHYFPEQGETKKFRFTKTFNFDFEITEVRQSYIYTQVENGKVSKLKIELGNRATDWTPAPEDMATQSQITQLSDAINLRVQKGDVINQINLDTSGVLISGKKLILDGDTTVTGDFKLDGSAHIKDASIGTAQIGTIDAYKINANNLESLSSKTGELEITGWLTISSTNYGIQSTYNYGDTYGEAYNARWFDGDYQLGYRYHKMTANVYEVTSSNTRGKFLYYTETFLGADMLKFREYNNRTQALNEGIPRYHLDIQANRIVMGKNWDTGIVLDAQNHSIYTEGASMFGERTRILGDKTGLLVGRVNAPMEYQTLQFNNDRPGLGDLTLGVDGIGRYVQSTAIRGRTYDLPANVYVSPDGKLGFASSSKKFKVDIQEANSSEIIEKLKQLDAKTWVRKDLYEKGVLERSYGLIAEDLHELGLVEFVSYDDDGEVVGIHEPRLVVPLIMWNKLLDKKLTDVTDDVEWLKLENQYLKQKIKQLEEMIA